MTLKLKIIKNLIYIVLFSLLSIKVSYSMNLFDSMDLENTVVKLSYFGPQNKPVDTLLFSVHKTEAPILKLKENQVFYDNDAFVILNLQVSNQALSKMINSVLRQKIEMSDQYELSVVVYDVKNNKIFERKFDRTQSVNLYKNIVESIDGPKETLDQISIWGSRTGFKK